MISDEDLLRDRLETHLSDLMRAACKDQGAAAVLVELLPGLEGFITISCLGAHESPVANIRDSLDLDGAETAVLHEAGHWLEGHEVIGSEARDQYQEAKDYDDANGTRTHGPFEQAADRRALSLLDLDEVCTALETDRARIAGLIVEDARQYGSFDAD